MNFNRFAKIAIRWSGVIMTIAIMFLAMWYLIYGKLPTISLAEFSEAKSIFYQLLAITIMILYVGGYILFYMLLGSLTVTITGLVFFELSMWLVDSYLIKTRFWPYWIKIGNWLWVVEA